MGDLQGVAFLASVVRRFCLAGVVLCAVSLLMPGYLHPGWWPQAFVVTIAVAFAAVAVLIGRFGISAGGLFSLALFVDACAATVPFALQDGAVGMVPLVGLSLPSVVIALYGSVRMLTAQTLVMLASAGAIGMHYTSQPGSVVVIVVAAAITLTGPAVVVAALRRRLDEALQRERVQARTDPLTRVANRRGMEDSIDALMERSAMTGLPIGVLVVDVDHFKQVNDQLGHEAGDRVLRAVSDALRACIREDDVLARFGGEEFVVLVVAAPDRLMDLAERVRVAVAGSQLVSGVTVSVGAAWSDPPGTQHQPTGEQVWQLIARGDELMYEAKRAGRNRVHCAVA